MRLYVWGYRTLGSQGIGGYLWNATSCEAGDRAVTEVQLLPPRCIKIGRFSVSSEPFGFAGVPSLEVELELFADEFPSELRQAVLSGHSLGIAVGVGRVGNGGATLRDIIPDLFWGIMEIDDTVVQEVGQPLKVRFVDVLHHVLSRGYDADIVNELQLWGTGRYPGSNLQAYREGNWVLKQRIGLYEVFWELRGGLALLDAVLYELGQYLSGTASSLMPHILNVTDTFAGRAYAPDDYKYISDVFVAYDKYEQPWLKPTVLTDWFYVPVAIAARQGSGGEWWGVATMLQEEAIKDWLRQIAECLLQQWNAFLDTGGLAVKFEQNGVLVCQKDAIARLGVAKCAWNDFRPSMRLDISGKPYKVTRRRWGQYRLKRATVANLPWGESTSWEFSRRGLEYGATYALGTVPAVLDSYHFTNGIMVVKDRNYNPGGLPMLWIEAPDNVRHVHYLRVRAYADGDVTLLTDDIGVGGDGNLRNYMITQEYRPWDFSQEGVLEWVRARDEHLGTTALIQRGVRKALPEANYVAEVEVAGVVLNHSAIGMQLWSGVDLGAVLEIEADWASQSAKIAVLCRTDLRHTNAL